MDEWYSRPVLFVTDTSRSVDFFVAKLGFSASWRYEDEVAQVNREGCEIILSSQQPGKVGSGMLFIELTADDFAALPEELAASETAFRRGHWGYPVLIAADPDGNELYFPAPDAPVTAQAVA